MRKSGSRSGLETAALTAAIMAGALAVRALADPWLGSSLPFVTLWIGVAAVAFTGGWQPAVPAALLGFPLARFFFAEPRGTFLQASDARALGVYVAGCAALVAILDRLRRAALHAEQLPAVAIADNAAREDGGSGDDPHWGGPGSGREVLALAMRGGRMGIWSRNLATNVVWWSPELEELFGLPPGGFPGTLAGYLELVHEDDRPALRRAVDQALATHGDYLVEFRFRHASGEWRWMEGRGRALAGPDGKPSMLYGLGIDITERKRSETALREADRQKDVFLATLAHELRNPLAPIRNAIDILGTPEAGGDAKDRARAALGRQVRHLARLVDDLLDTSRLSANKLHLRREPVALTAVVAAALETSGPLIDEAGHALDVRLPEESLVLDADQVRLAQVLSNLLNNAARYTQPGGHIVVAAERQGSDVLVSVTDNGIGIAPAMLPRLFEAFAQGELSEASRAGLGIGLSLARSLVTLHGGTIEVQSAGLGHGTCFTVRLPLRVGPPGTPPAAMPSDDARPAIRPRTILVADDLRDAADTLALLLRLEGHEVTAAYDGEAAFEAARTLRPDIAVLDIGMPRLNGYEVARRIREQDWGGRMALVALTGWDKEADRTRALAAGFDAQLVKPASLARLLELVETLTMGEGRPRTGGGAATASDPPAG